MKQEKNTECPYCNISDSSKQDIFLSCSSVTKLLERQPAEQRAWLEQYKGKEADLAAKKLGDIIWSRDTVQEDRKDAYNTLLNMAVFGNGQAQFECGRIYYPQESFWNVQSGPLKGRVLDPIKTEGAGVAEPDYRIATYYFDQAIRNGIPQAAEQAAYMYKPGFLHLRWQDPWVDGRKAVEYCIKGIRLGAPYCVGKLHHFLRNDREVSAILNQLIREGSEKEVENALNWLEEIGFFDYGY